MVGIFLFASVGVSKLSTSSFLAYLKQKENQRNLLLCCSLGSKFPNLSAFFSACFRVFLWLLHIQYAVVQGVIFTQKNREMYIYPTFLEAVVENCTFKKFLMNRCSHFPGIWTPEISLLVLSKTFCYIACSFTKQNIISVNQDSSEKLNLFLISRSLIFPNCIAQEF